MAYKTIITNLGQAKIASAIANSATVNLYEMALGDGNGNSVNPSPSQTSLVREVYRAQANLVSIDNQNPNWIIVEMVVPVGPGGWTVREVGLYDTVGALIAVGNFPATYKPLLSEGAGRDLVIRMIIEIAQPGVIQLTVDPGIVLATRTWVSDNFTLAIVLPGGTTGEVLRKKSNADGDFEWWDPASGTNIIVNTINEEQTLAAGQTTVNLAIATTTGAAIYVDGIRLFSEDYITNSETQLTLSDTYADGSKILIVQNDPLSSFSFLTTGGKLAEIAEQGGAAQLEARANLGIPEEDALMTAFLQFLYPVGEVLMTRRTSNPATWLGFGTWVRYAEGKTLVGFSASESEFNALDKTGGEKSHTLTGTEIPSHVHTIDPPSTATSTSGDHSHFIAASQIGSEGGTDANAASPIVSQTSGNSDVRYALKAASVGANVGVSSTSGGHTHSLDIPQFNSGSAGGGQAHNNLQPYVVVFFWRRTA